LKQRKLVPLEEWARATYASGCPSIYTLRRWCKAGRIFPIPEKHGRSYYVTENARYIENYNASAILGGVHDSTSTQ